MVATVKIIPFATGAQTLDASLAALGEARAVAVAPFRPLRVAVVSTLLPGLKASVIAKTLRSLERASRRPAPTSSRTRRRRTRSTRLPTRWRGWRPALTRSSSSAPRRSLTDAT